MLLLAMSVFIPLGASSDKVWSWRGFQGLESMCRDQAYHACSGSHFTQTKTSIYKMVKITAE